MVAEYTIENGTNVVDCDNSERTSEQVCLFDMNKLGSECTEENGYGYNVGKPCILLKINKVSIIEQQIKFSYFM